jgi:hypothetical protein
MLFMLLSINYGSFVLTHAWLLVPFHWILHKCNNNFMFKKRLINEHVQHMFHYSLFEVVINEWTFINLWQYLHPEEGTSLGIMPSDWILWCVGCWSIVMVVPTRHITLGSWLFTMHCYKICYFNCWHYAMYKCIWSKQLMDYIMRWNLVSKYL